LRGVWKTTVADVGLGDLAPHDLRHTAASLAISAGASVKEVQRMLGHSSAQITLDRYAHLFEDDHESLIESVDARYASAQARPKRNLEGVADLSEKVRKVDTPRVS
jgi:integrase